MWVLVEECTPQSAPGIGTQRVDRASARRNSAATPASSAKSTCRARAHLGPVLLQRSTGLIGLWFIRGDEEVVAVLCTCAS